MASDAELEAEGKLEAAAWALGTSPSKRQSLAPPAAVSAKPSYGRLPSRSAPCVRLSTSPVRTASTSESHARSCTLARERERLLSKLGETAARSSCSRDPSASSFCEMAFHDAAPPLGSSCWACRMAFSSSQTSELHSTSSSPPSSASAAKQQLSQWWQRRSPPAPLSFQSQLLSRPSALCHGWASPK